MSTMLVSFRCPTCGHQAFRYRAVFEQTVESYGCATCLLCPTSAYVMPPSRQELIAVGQALNAQAQARLFEQRHLPALQWSDEK